MAKQAARQQDAPGNPFVDAPGNPFKPTLEGRLASLNKPTLEERLLRAQQSGSLEERLLRAQQSVGNNLSDQQPMPGSDNAGVAFADAAGRTIVNNVLGLPRATGTALAFTAALPALIPGGATFGEQFEKEKGRFPASLLRSIPAPTINEIGANFRALPKLFPGGDTFTETRDRELAEANAAIEQLRTRFPIASAAGDVGGDVATLLTGRLPFAKGINKAETKLAGTRPDLLFGGAVPRITDPGARRFVKRVIDSPAVRSLARGAGRSLEAGFEAAALDLLKGDDPLETAAFAAGGQAIGSLTISISKGLLSGGPLRAGGKLLVTAASTGALIQLLKDVTPGGQDSLIDSIESGFEKVGISLILGGVAAVVGAGRLRGRQITEDFPKIMDAFATIPRATTISLLEDYVNASRSEKQQMELVLGKLTEDPEFFGRVATQKLQTALDNGFLAATLRKLQGNKQFTQRLFSLKPPELGRAK